MICLLLEDGIESVLPVFFFFIVFFVIVAVAISSSKKANNAQQQQKASQRMTENANGIKTVHQKEYLQTLRDRKQAQSINPAEKSHSDDNGHEHIGDEEHYEKIVGSLGDVNDEGCDELAGVRLIAHDLAYEGESENRNYSEVAKIVVLGDIINNPRFKNPHKK